MFDCCVTHLSKYCLTLYIDKCINRVNSTQYLELKNRGGADDLEFVTLCMKDAVVVGLQHRAL